MQLIAWRRRHDFASTLLPAAATELCGYGE
jgi:hypothetical protein